MSGHGTDGGDATQAWVVVVEHNLVVTLARAEPGVAVPAMQTKLEVATALAANFQRNGCLDGCYHFAGAERARVFATLCLEFTQALVERRLAALKTLAVGGELHAGDAPGAFAARRPS